MPEAPEVQTVVSTLEVQIKDRQVIDVKILYDKLIQGDAQRFCEEMKGQHFRTFSRWGKYLIIGLDTLDWIIHLRMEGRFYLYDVLPEDRKHIHAIFYLDDGKHLCYHDTRKFGRMALVEKGDWKEYPMLKKLGLDYTDEHADGDYLYQKIHHAKRSLKSALLDQSIIAGIGNIYADEICFSCGLDPRSRCTRISKKDCQQIVQQTKQILSQATKDGGTTIRTYTSSLGITGLFQLKLRIHDRKGQACPICGQPVEKMTVAQRGTYVCRHCQKRK